MAYYCCSVSNRVFNIVNSYPCSILHKKLINNISSNRRCSIKKGVLKNFVKFTAKHLCQGLGQMFSCEFCEIFRNTFFTGYLSFCNHSMLYIFCMKTKLTLYLVLENENNLKFCTVSTFYRKSKLENISRI